MIYDFVTEINTQEVNIFQSIADIVLVFFNFFVILISYPPRHSYRWEIRKKFLKKTKKKKKNWIEIWSLSYLDSYLHSFDNTPWKNYHWYRLFVWVDVGVFEMRVIIIFLFLLFLV